ncbi:MAG: hypothetical protein WCG87_05545 [Bacteroidota bacterium]
MARLEFTKNIDLLSFVDKLERYHYDVIELLCTEAQKQASKVNEIEVNQATSQYSALCNRLIEEMKLYIKNKKENLLPYLRKIAEKESEDHDCQNCSGGGKCNLQHDLQLSELKESHMHIKDILYRLQMATLPLYSETIYPDVYRILRNQMALLENSFGELFSLEETYLIPKVEEAQKNINANH